MKVASEGAFTEASQCYIRILQKCKERASRLTLKLAKNYKYTKLRCVSISGINNTGCVSIVELDCNAINHKMPNLGITALIQAYYLLNK